MPGTAIMDFDLKTIVLSFSFHDVEFVSWLLEGLGREPDVSQVLNKVLNTVTLSLELE